LWCAKRPTIQEDTDFGMALTNALNRLGIQAENFITDCLEEIRQRQGITQADISFPPLEGSELEAYEQIVQSIPQPPNNQ